MIATDLEARLKIAGYTVPGTADSAHNALQLIRKTSPDLVLMDIRLKGAWTESRPPIKCASKWTYRWCI